MQSSHTLDVRQSIPGHLGSLGNAGQASSARPSSALGAQLCASYKLKGLPSLALCGCFPHGFGYTWRGKGGKYHLTRVF